MIRGNLPCNLVTINIIQPCSANNSDIVVLPAPVGPVNPNTLVKFLHLKSCRTNHTVINSQTESFPILDTLHKPIDSQSHPVYAKQ